MPAERIQRFGKRDESGNQTGLLMNQLIEGVLAICSRLTRVDRRS